MSRTSNRESRAAKIMADQFSHSLLADVKDDKLRPWLYGWERKALEWLREWRKRDTKTPICSWTAHYMAFGPPPWKSRGLSLDRKVKL